MVKINSKQQQKINNALKLLDNSFNIKFNVVKLNVNNTIQHELAKCKLTYQLIKSGKQVMTEAIFKSGGRADIFVMEDYRVYEVLHSETEEEALKKNDYYPSEVDIILYKSKDVLDEVFEI